MYAVVDIETTGGNATYGKVIEVAVVVHDGIQITERFSSLVNPECNIPPFITMLTGITNKMVTEAPRFEEIAHKIHQLTHDKIFVAHNVNFDYSFLKKEFSLLNTEFERKKLCTVRLSRKLIPDAKKYNLGSICNHIGVTIQDRHRAMGDAEATALLLSELLKRDNTKETISNSLKRSSKEMSLPPNISKELFDTLPTQQGVYYFYDIQGKVIYVGKAKNIKERVGQHFSGNTHTKERSMFRNNIYDVKYEITGNELISLLLENELIKKYFPRYNKTNKTFNLNCGLYTYTDQAGYTRIVLGKAGKRDKPLIAFGTESEGLSFLLTKVKEYSLCLRLCGIIKSNIQCNYDNALGTDCIVCKGKIETEGYNSLVERALKGVSKQRTFVIKTLGRKEDEEGFVMVEKGRFLGFGYVTNEMVISNFEELKELIKPCYDTQDSQTIIRSFLNKSRLLHSHPHQVYSYN